MYLTALLAVGVVPAMGAALGPRAVNCDFATTADAGATCASFFHQLGTVSDRLVEAEPWHHLPESRYQQVLLRGRYRHG
jgi:hypothetical protein